MPLDPQRSLISTFNFRIALNRSGGSGSGSGGATASAGLSFSAGASLSAGSGLSGAASANVAAGVTGSAGAGSAQLGDGGFQECSGLQLEMEVHEINEGGWNDGVVRLAGRGRYTNIVLKRGMLYPSGGTALSELWNWLQGVISGQRPVVRYDGVIEVIDAAGANTVATWVFDRGLPAKIVGPQLNAKTGDIAIEELTIAHQGLRLRT
jgi:phage tail-like protein